MHYRLGFSSKLENPSVYIECSVRKPGIRHPVREIVKRFGKKKDLLAQDPLALEKIRQEVDEMNRNCKGRQLVSSPSSLKTLSADLSELLEQQSLDGQAVFESRIAGCLILQLCTTSSGLMQSLTTSRNAPNFSTIWQDYKGLSSAQNSQSRLQTPFLSCGTPSLSRNRLRQS